MMTVYSISDCSDEELAGKYQNASGKAVGSPFATELVCRYFPLIKHMASSFGVTAQMTEDIMQEGLLGFMGAVESFDPARNVRFSAFAYVCVRNRMNTAAAKLRRESMETADNDDGFEVKDDISPESIVMGRELMNEISCLLSKKENDVFGLYLNGMNCADIAARLNISEKSADNAVQRVKKKLRSYYL